MAYSFSRDSGALLFAEDFDLPPPRSEPEPVQPVFSAADLRTAREEAARESRDIATAEHAASTQITARLALAEIGRQIAASRAEATSIAEQSAEAIARLLLDCFASAFPALSARHGPDEVTAVIRVILPVLHREPKITVRVNPHIVEELTAELRMLDPDHAARVRLVPTDAMPRGDARIAWENGAAARDTASIWSQIETILTGIGPLDTEQSTEGYERVE